MADEAETNQRLYDWLESGEEACRLAFEAWGVPICTYERPLRMSSPRRRRLGLADGAIRPDKVRPLLAAWLGVHTRKETPRLASARREQAELALRKTLDSMGVADDWPRGLPATPAAERLADRLEDADDGSEDWKTIREAYRGAMGLTGLANRLGGDLPDPFAGWLRVEATCLPAKAACERALSLIKEPSC